MLIPSMSLDYLHYRYFINRENGKLFTLWVWLLTALHTRFQRNHLLDEFNWYQRDIVVFEKNRFNFIWSLPRSWKKNCKDPQGSGTWRILSDLQTFLQDLCQDLRFYKIFENVNDDLGRLSWKFTKILIQIFSDLWFLMFS